MSHDISLVTNIGIVCMENQEGCVKPRMPFQGSAQAAGWDISTNIADSVTLKAGEWRLFPTGLKLMIPDGYEIQVRPRSGLALKKGLTVLNAPGTIDSDYTGELGVILINHSPNSKVVNPYERIAQIVLKKVERVAFRQTATITKDTKRGSGGFGSSGE